MPSRKSTSNPLADRLAELGISPAELAAIVGVRVEEVHDWIENGPPAHGRVLTRFLHADDDALRRIAQSRRTDTTTLEGDGARYAGIKGVPYGTSDIGKTTGGVPS